MKSWKNILRLAPLAVLILCGSDPAHAKSSLLDPARIGLQQAVSTPPVPMAKPIPAPSVAAAQGQIQMPPPEALIIMVRASLVALSQANVTNNYTVLNQLGSQDFKQTNSPAKLSELFAQFRTNNIDLAPVVFVTPQLNQQPRIDNGKLRLVGFFPTQPMRVDFDLQFEPSDGIWKLLGISVNLSQAQTVSQSTQQPQFVPGQGGQAPSR
jgi:hypothetical protein